MSACHVRIHIYQCSELYLHSETAVELQIVSCHAWLLSYQTLGHHPLDIRRMHKTPSRPSKIAPIPFWKCLGALKLVKPNGNL